MTDVHTLRLPFDVDALRQWAEYTPVYTPVFEDDLSAVVPLSVWRQMTEDLLAAADELELMALEARRP